MAVRLEHRALIEVTPRRFHVLLRDRQHAESEVNSRLQRRVVRPRRGFLLQRRHRLLGARDVIGQAFRRGANRERPAPEVGTRGGRKLAAGARR